MAEEFVNKILSGGSKNFLIERPYSVQLFEGVEICSSKVFANLHGGGLSFPVLLPNSTYPTEELKMTHTLGTDHFQIIRKEVVQILISIDENIAPLPELTKSCRPSISRIGHFQIFSKWMVEM